MEICKQVGTRNACSHCGTGVRGTRSHHIELCFGLRTHGFQEVWVLLPFLLNGLQKLVHSEAALVEPQFSKLLSQVRVWRAKQKLLIRKLLRVTSTQLVY